jgi:pimeloyl-ACP methyl ester carboxylesterase
MMTERTAHFSEEFTARLAQDFGQRTAVQLNQWQSAPLSYAENEQISYVRLGSYDTAEQPPVIYVNGINAGIVAGAPFVGQMASRGFDMLLADQNRARVAHQRYTRRDATHVEAEALAAIISQENLENTPLSVITHSYGSLVFQALHGIAAANSWTCFQGSKVAMLAPAGTIKHDSPGKFLQRYRKLLHTPPTTQFPDGYQDFRSEMSRAGETFIRANKKRAFSENFASVFKKVSIQRMLRAGVSEFMVYIYAEDELYSEHAFEDTIKDNDIEGLSFSSPVSTQRFDHSIRSGQGAGHSDQQINPARTAGAVAEFLRHGSIR